jgi:hypothetical protein
MEKRTVLDRIEIEADGTVFLRLLKQIVDGEVLRSEPHRYVVCPSVSVSDQIAAVNAHLAQMGWPEIPADDIRGLESHVKCATHPGS